MSGYERGGVGPVDQEVVVLGELVYQFRSCSLHVVKTSPHDPRRDRFGDEESVHVCSRNSPLTISREGNRHDHNGGWSEIVRRGS